MAYLHLEDGRKLYYEEDGVGQSVVFIHGWKASSDVYADAAHVLCATGSYRCIRYDQCGHKRSDVPAEGPTLESLAKDLHSLITALHLERPILVGWSMGAMTVLEYIRHYGSRHLTRIVLVDCSPRALIDEDWHCGRKNGTYTMGDLNADYQQMQADFNEFLRLYYLSSKPGYENLPLEQQQQIVQQRMVGFDPRVLTELWYSMNQRDHRDLLSGINCPVAVFHAEIMPSCAKEAAAYYDSHIHASHKCVLFEGCSHGLISEAPQRFTDELLQFFAD
jgi:pimeloyl-ACP methyl ester carboxylesterase